jgi:HlyD family secretion protein
VRQAATAVTRGRAAHEFARREAERQHVLLREGAAARQAVEQAELAERMRGEETASAEFGLRVAESESRIARAALLRFDRPAGERAEQFEIRAPVDGRVLRIVQESEGAVQPGSPLLEIGDPRALEVVVDVLTADAVDIARGTRVRVERWGGAAALRGHVHHVEPSAFTRISSLGIEEQRVNVVIDLDEPRERWAALGDGYRVEARVIVWRANEVLQIPAGAVFRSGDGWAAYVADAGRARLRPLEIGRRNAAKTQVVRGLRAGERVIVYPGDDITDGVRIEAR